MSQVPDEPTAEQIAREMPEPIREPEHEDYADLQQIIEEVLESQVAAAIEAGEGFDIERFVETYIDPKSLAHTALSRVMAAFQITSDQQVHEQLPALMRTTAIYMEAFALGAEWTHLLQARAQDVAADEDPDDDPEDHG